MQRSNKLFFSTKLDNGNKKLKEYLLSNLQKYTNLSKSVVLDVGCGNGRFANLMKTDIRKYYGVDPSEEYIKHAKGEFQKINNIKFKIGRAENIPYTKHFDIILYTFSWHYIQNYKKAIKELNRLSNKKTIVVILEPLQIPKGYLDPRLNKNSKQFDKTVWKNKLTKLKEAEKIIYKQKDFNILFNKRQGKNLWILKKGD